MRLTFDINIEQQQKLVMTPELRQAIAVLQMSALELTEYLHTEIEKNPFLEMNEEQNESIDERRGEEAAEGGNEFDPELLEYFANRSDLGMTGMQYDRDREATPYENMVARAPSLHEHLNFQLHLTVSGEQNLRIGEFLIGCIDERGYLAVTLEEAQESLNVSREAVEKVLAVIQTFEPYGVGARDLKECLLIQLKQRGQYSTLAETIINDHLDDLAQGHLKQIASRLGIGIHETQDICNLIRSLDPKPGRQYGSGDEVRYLVPDIIVEKINGEYVVSINDVQSPHLFLNKFYQDMLNAPEAFSKEARKYLEEKLSSALWLIKSIEHRRLTLYNVVSRIVEMQKDFLDHGINYLKPLTLKQVAEKVQVHESTISRAIANKCVQTPQGVFELKYFFSSGVKTVDEEGFVSARSIKSMIKDMVENEQPQDPLSDQQICEMLAVRGINCSRRTVAKYRTELGIPKASARRRY